MFDTWKTVEIVRVDTAGQSQIDPVIDYRKCAAGSAFRIPRSRDSGRLQLASTLCSKRASEVRSLRLVAINHEPGASLPQSLPLPGPRGDRILARPAGCLIPHSCSPQLLLGAELAFCVLKLACMKEYIYSL